MDFNKGIATIAVCSLAAVGFFTGSPIAAAFIAIIGVIVIWEA